MSATGRSMPTSSLLLKQRNVTLIPTLIRDEFQFAYGDSPAWIDDPFFLKVVPPERLAVLKTKIRDEQAKHPQRHRFKAAIRDEQSQSQEALRCRRAHRLRH